MYLSRLVIDPLNRKAHYCLADQYAFHQVLHQAFDGDPPAVLYRIEPERHDQMVHVLVQSLIAPSWTRPAFAARLPVRLADGPKPVSLNLAKGQVLRFRLRANPTQAMRTQNLSRTGIIREHQQKAWLQRKLAQSGFVLGGHQIVGEGMIQIVKRSEERKMTFASMFCDGIVTVSDADLAIAGVQSGIGRGKAFGFGLLSLARVL